jgi:hypothetical protein
MTDIKWFHRKVDEFINISLSTSTALHPRIVASLWYCFLPVAFYLLFSAFCSCGPSPTYNLPPTNYLYFQQHYRFKQISPLFSSIFQVRSHFFHSSPFFHIHSRFVPSKKHYFTVRKRHLVTRQPRTFQHFLVSRGEFSRPDGGARGRLTSSQRLSPDY